MVSLRRHLDMRLDMLQAEIDRRFVSELRALEAATAATDHRLNVLDEFRAQLAELTSRYETVDTADTRHKEILDRLEKVETEQARARGRISAYAVIVGVAGVLLAFFGFSLEHFVR